MTRTGARLLVPSVILFFRAHAFNLLSGATLHVQQRSRRPNRPATSVARKWTMNGNSFRTEVDIPLWPEHNQLGYADSFFLIGSCFSDNIDKRLAKAKLETSLNPAHGTLRSLLSAARSSSPAHIYCVRRRVTASCLLHR